MPIHPTSPGATTGCFSVTNAGGGSTKTLARRRWMPIRRGLVRLLADFEPHAGLLRETKRGSRYKTGTIDGVRTAGGVCSDVQAWSRTLCYFPPRQYGQAAFPASSGTRTGTVVANRLAKRSSGEASKTRGDPLFVRGDGASVRSGGPSAFRNATSSARQRLGDAFRSASSRNAAGRPG